MMTLAEKLRERAASSGRTAQVECGELGSVTVEALPVREIELLLRGPDGLRKVFYAACRELQRAGEELRRAGQLYQPDGILQFVSDSEAESAARTILGLSGWTEPAGQNRKYLQPEPNIVASGDADHGSPDEIRLSSVQNFGKDFTEIRPAFVQTKRDESPEADENRSSSVQNLSQIQLPGGQDSRETLSKAGEKFTRSELVRKPQPMAFFSPDGAQNVVSGFFGAGNGTPNTEAESEPLHENKSEFGEGLHESKSELWEAAQKNLHEMTSENFSRIGNDQHETKSEFEEIPHESKSDSTRNLHDSESEFGKSLHETKSEFAEMLHETESDSAERMARQLLEGLRRAKWVRGG